MRWLLIVLLVSLAGLLIAAAGMARHIWRQRAGRNRAEVAGKSQAPEAKGGAGNDGEL